MPEIQNNLIPLIAKKVWKTTVNKIKHGKYYAMFDYITDAGHFEQMTMTPRYADKVCKKE
jgi:hypothetical protein